MSQTIQVLRIEGVEFLLDWGKFEVGAFVFVPCLDTAKVANELREFCNGNVGYTIQCRSGMYKGMWGVGVRRVE